MNKGELVKAVAERTKLTLKDADAVITAVFDEIQQTVASGEKVTLVGFGTFEARKRAEREGRNPKTNEKMLIPATVAPAFSAGKTFKEAVLSSNGK